MQRAQKLRMTGLAGVAALAVAVPLGAAMAGPAEPLLPHRPPAAPRAGQGMRTTENHPMVGRYAAGERGARAGNNGAEVGSNGANTGEIGTKVRKTAGRNAGGTAGRNAGKSGAQVGKGAAAAGLSDGSAAAPAGSPAGLSAGTLDGSLDSLGLPLLSGRTTHCGPELASGRGIEAQTCVLTESGRTWARTYYRNITGGPLRAVLTLLRPDGRSVQVNCEVPAADVPGVCETPAGRTVRTGAGRTGYAAVAEFADPAGERLLLRSGSNSATDGRGSG
ncbi:hypothetical protein [Streptomyces sp. NPDC059649]|uniref:hypothetical protein n=1 Tax=Streptomyces sp. NPDC059649 TaxID=3346895 RepID=UPI003692A5F2